LQFPSRVGRRLSGLWLWLIRPLSALIFLNGISAGVDILPPALPTCPEAIAAIEHGKQLRAQNRLPEAIACFRDAQAKAHSAGDLRQEVRALNSTTGCLIRSYQYRAALQSSDAARQLALTKQFDDLAGAIANNRSTIYSQLGDFEQALQEATDAVTLFRHGVQAKFLSQALANLGDTQAQLGRVRDSVRSFQEAATLAHKAGLAAIEASAQDHLGLALISVNDLTGAESALSEAKRLRQDSSSADAADTTSRSLAELRFRQGRYSEALAELNSCRHSHSFELSELPKYWEPELRGNILLAMGRRQAALAQYASAIAIADAWRQGALPGDVTSTRTVVTLHEIYQSYIQLAAELAVSTHNQQLAERAYEVLIQNRASSLREQILSVLGRQLRLPPKYYELLRQLQSAQALVTLGKNPAELEANQRKLDLLRLQLANFENEMGLQDSPLPQDQGDHSRSPLLRSLQSRLGDSDLLLSFTLGQNKSFLWAVSKQEVVLGELPAEGILASHVKAFSEAVRQQASFEAQGRQVGHELLGSIPKRLSAKANWLIAGDGVLLDGVPFASLPEETNGKAFQPITVSHSLRFVPSELLLTDPKRDAGSEGFVGVADPIYNFADTRRPHEFSLFPVSHPQTSITLARLVGSEREVRTAAASSGLKNVRLLTGVAASGENVRKALAEHPAVVHFAVHVVSPDSPGNPAGHASQDAALALSLGRGDLPELLTRENVASLRVHGSLVVLSGCASQQGEYLPSAGLVGLSRAWLLAGASGIIVSAWPTPDDSGHFFSTFYSHLREQSPASGNLAVRASAALQQTQVEMQRSAGYRSAPSFWASYSLISKE
jgi:CHAT domain-containing protein/tetratricopeptide (TPR) repeat protein